MAEDRYGMKLRITDAYRSYEEQAFIYGSSRSQDALNAIGYPNIKARPDDIWRTNAKPGQSNHNYGLAIDVSNFTNGYDPNDDQSTKTIAPLARNIGLMWGGDWKTKKDFPHFEAPGNDWHTLIKLPKDKNGYVILHQ